MIALRRLLAPVSGLGWGVLAAAVACWILGAAFDWDEFVVVAAAALVLSALCCLMTIGRTRLQVSMTVIPHRVTVGSPATGQVEVTNTARSALLPILLEMPIGATAAQFSLPLLRGGARHDEVFIVPTDRRGVVPIGPARTVRGDPLGLVRRDISWTGVTELFVHPVTVPLESLGSGLLRDLEGHTTEDVSMSDLAFHTLREYQPGDDRRYIHWRSSAKVGRFMVRQFLDTRRSHFATVVDSCVDNYADAEDYEVAISVGASVAVRALLDEQDLTVIAGNHTAPSDQGRRVLDVFSRAELGRLSLAELCVRAALIAPDISVVLLITGSRLPYLDIQRAASHFPPEVRTVVVRVDRTVPTGLRSVGGLTMLSLRSLEELPALLQGAIA